MKPARLTMLLALPLLCGFSTPEPTPAEARIARAQRAIETTPENPNAHVELAFALARRARETADPAWYARGEKAVARALELADDHFGALKARTWLLLGQHRFAQALELASELNRRVPDDVQVYGFLVDAQVELGDYDAAEEAAQWMLDLRPGNLAGLTRAAYLRELFGDVEGAIDLFEMAFGQLSTSDAEDRAWILTQIAHLRHTRGQNEAAATIARQALTLFPDYHYALAALASALEASGSTEEALALWRRRYDVAPHPENLVDIARTLDELGRADEAAAYWRRFEDGARAEMDALDNANRELIAHYADRGRDGDVWAAEEALRLATAEIERRDDVLTLTAYADALEASGRLREAHDVVERALSVGLSDADIALFAARLAHRLGDVEAVRRNVERAVRADPTSKAARAALELPTDDDHAGGRG